MCIIYYISYTIERIPYTVLLSFLALSLTHTHTYVYISLSQKTNKIVVTPFPSIVSIPSEKFSRYVYYINIIMCPVEQNELAFGDKIRH